MKLVVLENEQDDSEHEEDLRDQQDIKALEHEDAALIDDLQR